MTPRHISRYITILAMIYEVFKKMRECATKTKAMLICELAMQLLLVPHTMAQGEPIWGESWALVREVNVAKTKVGH